MRPLWKDLLAAVWLGMLLPGTVLQCCVLLKSKATQQPEIQLQETKQSQQSILLRSEDDPPTTMEMDQYLIGVVLGEMPASFEEEALKAQAVAARTYTCKNKYNGGKHGDGSLCTNPSCCQAYLTEEEYLLRGGTQEGIDKIGGAVLATESYVLVYEGELIEAVYFSSSGGMTESALAVWGTDFPYLQSVKSPDEITADQHMDTVFLSADEFQELLGKALPGTSMDWFGKVTYTDGGGVEMMEINGEVYTGTTLRSLMNLRSTAFTITPKGDQLMISTRGYGHRVGLSQYGANAMAEAGRSYEQILSHYYPGTTLVALESIEKNYV